MPILTEIIAILKWMLFPQNNNINCDIMSNMQLFAKLSNNYYA